MNASIGVEAVRFGFLVLLWAFVFVVLRVIRTDIFASRRGSPAPPPAVRPAQAPAGPPPGPAQVRAPQVPTQTGAAPPAPRQLVVTAGPRAGTRVRLSDAPITIGRAEDSTVILTDDYASFRHAKLSRGRDGWYVDDLGSTNGTYLGQSKVTGPTRVPPGVPIRIGKTALELMP